MKNYSGITDYIKDLADLSDRNNGIKPEMYGTYDVKRGLRDINGNGVVAGLTEVSRIKAKEKDADGNEIPCRGELYYRGIKIYQKQREFPLEKFPDLDLRRVCVFRRFPVPLF